jgi:CBS domain-containing protein
MPTVKDVLLKKGTTVVFITPDQSAREAAQLMDEKLVGGLLVVDDANSKKLVGVITERDILRRVVSAGLPADQTSVRDVMTTTVVTCVPDTSIEECSAIMTKRRIRHLPVADENTVYGIVTTGDMLAFRVAQQDDTIQYLNSYMFGMA